MIRSAFSVAILLASSVSLLAQTTPSVPSFEEAYAPYTLGAQYLSPVAGDFNKDGKPDFIIAGASSTTSPLELLLGNADGTFQQPIAVGTANSQIVDIDVADVNKDGNLDIITIDAANNFSVFYGNGNGTFQAPLVIPTTGKPLTGTIGNFFNDGYTDVAVADNNGDIEVFRNSGGRAFVLSSTIQTVVPAGSSTTSAAFLRLRAGNVNGTGLSDLVALTSTAAYVFWNTGQSTFTKALLGNYPYPFDLTVGSVNQSPNADIIVSYACNVSNVQAGHVDPYDCAGVDVYYGQGNNKTFFRNAVTDNGLIPATSIFAVDVNGDGIADLVAFDQQPNGTFLGLYVWLGQPDGSFVHAPQVYNTGADGPLVAGDWNRDGMMDFVQLSLNIGTLETYINGGQRGTCQTSSISPTVTVCQPVNNTYAQPVVNLQATAYDKNRITALQEYVDGQLEYSEAVTSLDYTSFALSPGQHSLVTKAWDATGISFRSDRTVTVYNGTPGPTCPADFGSANMCLPSTATSTSPVLILANGSSFSVPTAAQLYIDGVLKVNNRGYCYSNGNCAGGTSYVQTTQTLAVGSHNLVFKLYDAGGNVYTAQKTITVQ